MTSEIEWNQIPLFPTIGTQATSGGEFCQYFVQFRTIDVINPTTGAFFYLPKPTPIFSQYKVDFLKSGKKWIKGA